MCTFGRLSSNQVIIYSTGYVHFYMHAHYGQNPLHAWVKSLSCSLFILNVHLVCNYTVKQFTLLLKQAHHNEHTRWLHEPIMNIPSSPPRKCQQSSIQGESGDLWRWLSPPHLILWRHWWFLCSYLSFSEPLWSKSPHRASLGWHSHETGVTLSLSTISLWLHWPRRTQSTANDLHECQHDGSQTLDQT